MMFTFTRIERLRSGCTTEGRQRRNRKATTDPPFTDHRPGLRMRQPGPVVTRDQPNNSPQAEVLLR